MNSQNTPRAGNVLQRFPGFFTLLAIMLSILVIYGVRYYESHFAGKESGLTRKDLELTEFILDEPSSSRAGAWKFIGRVKNNSTEYVLTYLVIGIFLKECASKDCATVDELEETVDIRVPPGERGTIEKDIYFPKIKEVSKTWSWYYKIISIGFEPEKVSASSL